MPSSVCFPLVRRIDPLEPIEAMRRLAGLPYPFLLHSALPGERARWSFFGADPFAIQRGGDSDAIRARWRALAALEAPASSPDAPPFTGGAVGTWSYDYGRRLERLPSRARDDLGLPDLVLGLYDVVGAVEHGTGETRLVSSGLPYAGGERGARARARLDAFTRRLAAEPRTVAAQEMARGAPRLARSTFGAEAYRTAVERVREHIRRGDIFQANLSQRWTVPLPEARTRAAELHAALAECSPAPFAAWLDLGDHAVASASPERFLAIRGREVEARPIKGTRPRGGTAADDHAQAAALLASAKDRAENVMIVDVLRNDIGRVCETGTVRVPVLCELERFPQVFHLTSTVAGRLRADRDAFDLLAATFPGGSITGAPKIRAMEIIDALEPVRRHLYTGAIGWLGWNGDADWNIAIRTALLTEGAIHFAAGGGITADSDPEAERLETLDKAEGLRRALERLIGPLRLGEARVPAGSRA